MYSAVCRKHIRGAEKEEELISSKLCYGICLMFSASCREIHWQLEGSRSLLGKFERILSWFNYRYMACRSAATTWRRSLRLRLWLSLICASRWLKHSMRLSATKQTAAVAGKLVDGRMADGRPTDSTGFCPSSALAAAASMSVDAGRHDCSCHGPRRDVSSGAAPPRTPASSRSISRPEPEAGLRQSSPNSLAGGRSRHDVRWNMWRARNCGDARCRSNSSLRGVNATRNRHCRRASWLLHLRPFHVLINHKSLLIRQRASRARWLKTALCCCCCAGDNDRSSCSDYNSLYIVSIRRIQMIWKILSWRRHGFVVELTLWICG